MFCTFLFLQKIKLRQQLLYFAMKSLKLEYHFDHCEIREFHGISFPTGEDGGKRTIDKWALNFCVLSQPT